MRSITALLVLSGAVLALSACGGGSSITPAAARLEREDLVAVSRTLSGARPMIGGELAAAKAAWPLIANGLPADAGSRSRARGAIQTAAARAAQLTLPALFQEHLSASITGPGSELAMLFRNYVGLATRGWQMIGAAIDQIEHGSANAARFARANVALYIESVYDGHFDLAQIGKLLADGYEKLGGAAAFGASLTRAEVDALARAYSQASARLHPHTGVRLGS